jgi:hypothetical protein
LNAAPKKRENPVGSFSRCLMLSIDGTEESLEPVRFLSRLFPDPEHINLLLCHILPSLPPLYKEESGSRKIGIKKRELIRIRTENSRAIMMRARSTLTRAGFLEEFVQEHVQEKTLSVARETCLLADMKKVDAVVIRKQAYLSFDRILMDDPATLLLQYCILSPIWVVDGTPDPSRAAFLIQQDNASLRSVDHASFMLADSRTEIKVVLISRSASQPIVSPSPLPGQTRELQDWFATTEGKRMQPFVSESCAIIKETGIEDSRVQVVVLPRKRTVDSEILSYCQQQGIGILALGYPGSTGLRPFLKSLPMKRIIGDFRDISVWISQ